MANQKHIYVYLDWLELGGLEKLGILQVEQLRGKEVFSFSYNKEWLESGFAMLLDPDLGLYGGPQYLRDNKPNFGLFMDSAPDRWGRVLMQRREALNAGNENRKVHPLFESDFLLGVYDLYRMGALRFRLTEDGPFLHNEKDMTVPPFTSLRTLEEASLRLEDTDNLEDPAFAHWLSLLISPGSSLGGARPKASVKDPEGNLWIAKFPSRNDDRDIGAWEAVVNELALKAGLLTAEGNANKISRTFHTFLTKRFDRVGDKRIHFASAMTLLGYSDGMDAGIGVSYLHLAEFIMRYGAAPERDLEELWRRIVFYICVSNSDDHLRNHGFLLTAKGWRLSPAFDINPIPRSTGLTLNISEHSNILDVDLAREVAGQFRISPERREEIIAAVSGAVSHWRNVAGGMGIPRREIEDMRDAFKQ
ncbi:MAG TPA: HipA domain-containing protein [Puia sp.]|nr:HipA domain-containing protein [Puia sp.]